MARIAVTGAAGFIGRHLCVALSEAGHEVTGFVRRPGDGDGGTGDIPLAVLDPDPQTLARHLAGVTLVIHAAAVSPGPGRRVEDFARNNILATAGLVHAARLAAVPRVIQLSAISVYGRPTVPMLEETTVPVDPDGYGLSKRMAELVLAQAVDQGELDGALVLRLPGVVGPGMNRPWLGELARGLKAGREVTIYNPGALFNNALHIVGLCGFVTELAGGGWPAGFDCVNLAAGRPLPVAGVVEVLRTRLSSTSPVKILSPCMPSWIISTRRAEELYRFKPEDMMKLLHKLGNDILASTE
ncbi:NAD(P)-dependent oxidoreductase [Azospirillum sp. Sh1]|uniref:NAD-dependent epimerase/dehydratase family protein n=1 Tax=Azospirillum sp. Sh1 TaxID=2607285 RepID=UPI0011EE35A3|nr:NAD(P)-dependent oxidoreductase [Azospirillum sp. Sh1]KAA0579311.1 NAD(P)-dependent oxidoreductase [Azospirillum sp. Sh1]